MFEFDAFRESKSGVGDGRMREKSGQTPQFFSYEHYDQSVRTLQSGVPQFSTNILFQNRYIPRSVRIYR